MAIIEIDNKEKRKLAAEAYEARLRGLKIAETMAAFQEMTVRSLLKKQQQAELDAWRAKYNLPPIKKAAPEPAKKGKAASGQSGQLVEHGWARFNFDPQEQRNYFVRWTDANDQERVTWGIDLERAVKESGAESGQNITLENKGRQPITIQIPVKDSTGKIVDYTTKETHRNEWAVNIIQPGQDAPQQPQEGENQHSKASAREKGPHRPTAQFSAGAMIDAETAEKIKKTEEGRTAWKDKKKAEREAKASEKEPSVKPQPDPQQDQEPKADKFGRKRGKRTGRKRDQQKNEIS